jgi:hypothetical protein
MITLQTLQGTGIVKIQSYPPGATLVFNGDDYGSTPVTITNVDEGEHSYTLTMEGYSNYDGKAVVMAGELCCVDVSMETGIPTTNCAPAARTPCAGNGNIPGGGNGGGLPGIGPGYLVIPERTVIYILGGILIGAALVWIFTNVGKKST